MKRRLSVLLAVSLLVAIIGCATTSTQLTASQQADLNFYKVLAGAKASYDATFQALANLQKQGKLSDADALKAVNAGNIFYLAYMVAESTYEVYHGQVVATPGQTPTNEAVLTQQIADVSKKIGDFLATMPTTK